MFRAFLHKMNIDNRFEISILIRSLHCFSVFLFKFPDGESSSDFVFVCSSPHELLVKFPVKGRHKICECWSEMLPKS